VCVEHLTNVLFWVRTRRLALCALRLLLVAGILQGASAVNGGAVAGDRDMQAGVVLGLPGYKRIIRAVHIHGGYGCHNV
jgi:hypothetical protein